MLKILHGIESTTIFYWNNCGFLHSPHEQDQYLEMEAAKQISAISNFLLHCGISEHLSRKKAFNSS